MQGYSVKRCSDSGPTKRARWIIIQMFWAETLNGMWSRLTSRKILITHLISHCTSSAPGELPLCVCGWERESESAKRTLGANVLKAWNEVKCVETKMRKSPREKSVTHYAVFSSHRISFIPLSRTYCEFKGESSVMNYTFNCLHLILLMQASDWFLLSKHVLQRGSLCMCVYIKRACLLLLGGHELIAFHCPPLLNCADR